MSEHQLQSNNQDSRDVVEGILERITPKSTVSASKKIDEMNKNKEATKGSSSTADEKKSEYSESEKDFKKLYEDILKENSVNSKRASDNQKHARKMQAALNSFKSGVSKMEESGEIDEEIANLILGFAEIDDIDDGISLSIPDHVKDMNGVIAKAKEAFKTFLEYAPSSEKEMEYADAFDMYAGNLDESGLKELVKELQKNEDSPKELLKTMLKRGQEFSESSVLYKGLKEKGNIENFVIYQQEKIGELEKQIKELTEEKEKTKNTEEDYVAPSKTSKSYSFSPQDSMREAFRKAGVESALDTYLNK